ncbi:MAG: hypothetical protein IJU91_03165 [Selenomonadaceae bacterium]|nr:hypothetical protein [Selenomonadaceae bacterium]
MFTNTALNFPHGAMLTSAMLREIYKYPREFFALLYKNYGDGIICGLDYLIRDKNLFLTAGVIRLDGEFYFLPQDFNISAETEKNNLKTDKQYYICLSRLSEKKEDCLIENNLTVTFSSSEIFPSLGKFYFSKYDPLALPQLDKGVDPFKNIFESTVLNLADVPVAESFAEPIAEKGGATFHPLLFRLVQEFLAGKKFKTPFDYAILTQLQSTGVISIQTIKSYIAEEGGKINLDGKITLDDKINFTDRADLFKTFCKCLVASKFNPAVSRAAESEDSAKPKKIYTGYGKRW